MTKSNIGSLYHVVFQMTELARSQIAETSIIPPVNTDSALMDQRREHKSSKPQDNNADSDRYILIITFFKLF